MTMLGKEACNSFRYNRCCTHGLCPLHQNSNALSCCQLAPAQPLNQEAFKCGSCQVFNILFDKRRKEVQPRRMHGKVMSGYTLLFVEYLEMPGKPIHSTYLFRL